MYVCLCHGISETRLQQAIHEGARSFEQLQSCTGVATCCGACEPCAREMLLELLQPAVVDDGLEDRVHVVRHAMVGGEDVVQVVTRDS